MSAISQKSISGITSITTPTGIDNQFTLHINDTSEALKLDHAGNIHIHNHVNTTGISSASNFKTGTSDLHSAGLNVAYADVDDFVDVGSNIKLGNAGVITATSFVGSGAALTGIDATAIKDSGGNVKVQAQASGAMYTGIHTFSSGAEVGSNIKLGNAGVVTATSFTGSGANLTSLPAGQLTGTVADARISTLTASKLTGALPAISGANLTGLASREFYGFTGIGNSLSLTTTNSGADNIDNATYVAFEESFIGPSGISFSINTSGNLIMTI